MKEPFSLYLPSPVESRGRWKIRIARPAASPQVTRAAFRAFLALGQTNVDQNHSSQMRTALAEQVRAADGSELLSINRHPESVS
jgi:hypothetical protein